MRKIVRNGGIYFFSGGALVVIYVFILSFLMFCVKTGVFVFSLNGLFGKLDRWFLASRTIWLSHLKTVLHTKSLMMLMHTLAQWDSLWFLLKKRQHPFVVDFSVLMRQFGIQESLRPGSTPNHLQRPVSSSH